MRKPYPITTYRLPSRAPHSIPSQQIVRRISLVTLQEELQLPMHRGTVGARRLKIVRIEQAAVLPDALTPPRSPMREPMPVSSQLVAAPRRALPPPQLGPQELEGWIDGKPARLRNVGEVMADEAGNFYEVAGQQLRPLGELVSDERGRIFEVQPASDTQPAAAAKEVPSGCEPGARASTTDDHHRAAAPSPPARTQAVQAADSLGYRKIIADPGLYLKIPWVYIKSELAPQLKHPEKLHDDDLIECNAQIYEAQRTMPVAHIAAAELGDGALQAQLHPLTRDKAQMLGTPQLFKPTHEPFETRAMSRQIYTGQRVYRIWLVFDPTVEREVEHCVTPIEAKAAPRNQIPQQYLNPLRFKYSREEALYDMKGVLGTLPPESGTLARWFFIYPLRLLKTLVTLISSRRRMKKWRAMLKGKSTDEQLWAVTPPRGFSYHPTVRRWAEETLTRAGYDSERMFLELEIFWRRKGWN
ncbi:MAG: hypothetical protein MOB07_31300 [Acidobacteria bacterium]|nr:hypothetical protein [Acidobacteriota bacterium]